MSVKLYYDLMSQPSRALYVALKASKANLELKYLDLRKGAHFSEEYSKINKFQKVPVIEYNGFTLTESIAIVRYLSRQNIIPENIYPKNDDKLQARVDEFLEWYHIGLRLHTAMFTRVVFINPGLTGERSDEKTIAGYKKRLENALNDLEKLWLGQGTMYLTGNNANFADLLGATEIEQIRMAGFTGISKYPNTAKWLDNVRKHFSPYYEEAHEIVNKIAAKHENKAAKL